MSPERPPGRLAAVVLAGGASRRFGADKLGVEVEGSILLERALSGLPADAEIVVVGPARGLTRPVRFVREDPPGGGPTAALVTGLRAALADGADLLVVLPGDAPQSGEAAGSLLAALATGPQAAVVATDADGVVQPLQLALGRSAATALVDAAGAGQGHGASARALLERAVPGAVRRVLPTAGHFDIDTPGQLAAWSGRRSASVVAVLDALDRLDVLGRPAVVALDGFSGAGKSTLAGALSLARRATVVGVDDFYNPRLAAFDAADRAGVSDAEVVDLVFDWRRLRVEALAPLAGGAEARYAPYDWAAGDGRLGRPRSLASADLVVVEGVYSARPELADLVDLAVCVDADPEIRRARLAGRISDDAEWAAFWQRGERYYFSAVRPPQSFDLRVRPVDG